jgi:DNA gyrase subunit B
VDIAFSYTRDYKELIESFVNNIKTVDGGTHVTGFRSGLTKAVMRALPSLKIQKELKETITGDDLREGLVAVISCKVPEPQFEGQTKTKLGNQNVKNITESIVYEQLSNFFEDNRDILRLIVEKAIEAAWQGRRQRRQRNWSGENLPWRIPHCPVSWRTVPRRTQKNASSL